MFRTILVGSDSQCGCGTNFEQKICKEWLQFVQMSFVLRGHLRLVGVLSRPWCAGVSRSLLNTARSTVGTTRLFA